METNNKNKQKPHNPQETTIRMNRQTNYCMTNYIQKRKIYFQWSYSRIYIYGQAGDCYSVPDCRDNVFI